MSFQFWLENFGGSSQPVMRSFPGLRAVQVSQPLLAAASGKLCPSQQWNRNLPSHNAIA
jgi:hypothetical protein